MRLHLEKRTVWRFLSDLVVLIVGVGLCWARGGVGPHAAARPKSTSISNVIKRGVPYYRVAKTQRIPYLYRSFPAKETGARGDGAL